MPDLGRAALATTFLLLVYASVAGTFAAWHRRRRLAESAQNALIAAFVATGVGVVVLLTALAVSLNCDLIVAVAVGPVDDEAVAKAVRRFLETNTVQVWLNAQLEGK